MELYKRESEAKQNFENTFGLINDANDVALKEIFDRADVRAKEARIEAAQEAINDNRNRYVRKAHHLKSISSRLIISMMIIGAVIGLVLGASQMVRFYGPIVNEMGAFATCLVALFAGVILALVFGVLTKVTIIEEVAYFEKKANGNPNPEYGLD